jgi:DNA mismatch repair ATPase MutL
MPNEPHRISLLPDDVRAKVSSSYDLVTPEEVVDGLFQNALDAGARSISIEADFAKGWITLSDDGIGVRHFEFSEEGCLARLHCKFVADAAEVPH